MKKQSLFFVPGIILIGVSLRTPFTVLPIILGNISQGLEVEVSSLGVLTSLPLLMFTLFSPFSTQLAQKIGLEHLFTYSLFFLTIGSLIRLINLPLLYLGTLMVGASVAVINVLLPSLIQANQPKKIGFLTTLYVTSMGIATALASYLAVPITQASSWKGLILLTLLCLATFLVWLPNHRYNHRLAPQTKQKSQIKAMRNKQVWAIIIFSGFQSLIFYTVMTWLPTMSIHAGLSSHEAGLLTSILSLISIPFSMTIPSLTTSLSTRNRQLMLTLVSLAGVVGISMLFFPINNFIYWLAIHLLIGTATSALFPYLMVNFSLKTSAPEKTAQLSGLSQTGGYILAAFGPTLFGYSFDLFHSWVPSVAALLLIDILMTVALFTVDRADKIL